MKIKVCGISRKANLDFLNASDVDFIGFIFYDKSVRNFVKGDIQSPVQSEKIKVGVFVNESINEIERIATTMDLNTIQLHGDESLETCAALKQKGFCVIKAFAIKDELPLELKKYRPEVDYFLFDTKGANYGGNGSQFDWSVLNDYELDKPFFLSGGIGLEDVEIIKQINHPKLMAVDVNSRFEVSPGLKNEKELKEFIEELKK